MLVPTNTPTALVSYAENNENTHNGIHAVKVIRTQVITLREIYLRM